MIKHTFKRNKYGAKKTVVDGITFDSMKEARYYSTLMLAKKTGELLFFLRQVPLHLPGGTKLVVDFVEFWADGEVKVTDVKGIPTPVYKIKKREVEHHYPFKINEV